jgi:hypothetical protein
LESHKGLNILKVVVVLEATNIRILIQKAHSEIGQPQRACKTMRRHNEGLSKELEELLRENAKPGDEALATNPLMAVAMSELVESLLALGIQGKLYALTRSTGSFLPTLSLHWVKCMAMAGIPSSTTWTDLFPSLA